MTKDGIDPAVETHLKEAGSKGGRAATEAQLRARRLNLYRYLARKWPHSTAVAARLRELEGTDAAQSAPAPDPVD